MDYKQIRFGVDYYPEHWPRDRWETDARLMREAGLEVVRMGEFSWAKMESDEGKFDFAWLEEAITVLAKEGIKTILGTPTATPPAWIIERNPEILPVDDHGVTRGFGGRHHDCQSNETYRTHIRRFVTAMAKRFANNPHVIGWQPDNEFGNSHRNLCMCDSCAASFRVWLKKKYKTLDALNEAWGTGFWSQTYSKFEQISAPLPTPNSHSPGLLLDWKRFCSDLIVDFQKLQIDILRRECPHHFITHNYMGFFDKTDYFDLGRDLDFVSHDQYPLHFRKDRYPVAPPERLAAALDLMRGIKRKPFWVMEQQGGPSGWETLSASPRPGQLRLWTYQSVAHGADAVVYFRWRTCLFGTEQYWHGLLPHDGKPGRRYDEVKKTAGELKNVINAFAGGDQGAEAAILFSYDQDWAFQVQPHHFDFDYITHLMTYYTAFYKAQVPVDLIPEEADWKKYKLLVAPLQFLTTPELVAKLTDYVATGGHLVLTMRTGVKDWNNRVIPHTLPGPLSEVLGLSVDEYDCLWGVEQAVRWSDESRIVDPEPCVKWCDVVAPTSARALAKYTLDYYGDTPAITENSYKKGASYYVGTELGPEVMKTFVAHALDKANIRSILSPAPSGVEVTRRRAGNHDYIFILNHNSIAAEVRIPKEWKIAIGEAFAEKGILSLPAYEVAVCISE
ncbi:MAG: beta-galactosidase [Treponemataceae bacterium]